MHTLNYSLVRIAIGRDGIYKLDSGVPRLLAHWRFRDIKDSSYSGFSFTLVSGHGFVALDWLWSLSILWALGFESFDYYHSFTNVYPARAHGGVMWSGLVSIYIYMYIYVYDPPPQKKSLNDTLAVDSPFQTIVVDVSSNL